MTSERRPERRAPSATTLLLSNIFGMLVPGGVADTRSLDDGAVVLAARSAPHVAHGRARAIVEQRSAG